MQLLIVGGDYKKWPDLFIKAAGELNIECEFINVKDINFLIENSKIIVNKESEFEKSTHIIFLAEKYEFLYYLLCLIYKGKRIINGESILKFPNLSNKFIQYILLAHHNLSSPKTQLTISENLDLSNFELPLIFRKLQSDSGIGIEKMDDMEILKETHLVKDNKHDYAVQEFIVSNENSDRRSIFFKYEHIGTVKRTFNEGFKVGKTAIWNLHELDKDLKLNFINILKKLDIEYAAIDYVSTDSGIKIYEINRFPFFGKFQEVSNIDVAKLIINGLKDENS